MATLIAVEGPDRVGKQTQVGMLAEWLRLQGRKVKVVEVPFHDLVTHGLIYFALRTGIAKKLPRMFQCLQVLNRLLFQVAVLPFLATFYDYIIFDRWSLSTIVYGQATGTSREFNESITSWVVNPHATVVINGPARNPEARDSYESDAKLQSLVRMYYSEWCREHQLSSKEISSLGTPTEVHDKVTKAVKELLTYV